MTEDALFDVHFTGKVKTGHSPKAAIAAFAKLAKIETTKAAQLVKNNRAIKKSVSLERAESLRQQMEKLGLLMAIKPQGETIAPQAPDSNTQPISGSAGLTLAPMEPTEMSREQQASDTATDTAQQEPEAHTQAFTPETQLASGAIRYNKTNAADDSTEEISPSTVKILLAAGTAALLGALLWKFVAITFELELGLLAWAIGGMIGAAAVYFGAEGDNAGYLCGALALVAILGGKYWVASSFTETYLAEMNNHITQEEFDDFISVARDQIAPLQAALASDRALREHIIDNNYVVGVSPSEIPEATVAEFRTQLQEDLNEAREVGSANTIEEFSEQYGHIATSEIFKASFGWLDFLFLGLGVYTAFNMARSGSSPLGRKAY
ncbi:hypothetical protein [Gilvimarinus xylanilyticus]|uniref:Uncharacterized protein n=1 Tax=Gilvimarinus xylanilyticus TaxID=2944139 RepID=A0A9X2KWT7_9GAMM|nr:hypothetical protein [Gilvimarinus xylanilyticus]MCP8899430.1 hypothetical protein [Gilvimarinus xylanilyticus]